MITQAVKYNDSTFSFFCLSVYSKHMQFNIGSFILGFMVIADNFGSGAASYSRYKMVGMVTSVVGLLMMFNLHTIVLDLIGNAFFGGVRR